jgi:hypothetical protein
MGFELRSKDKVVTESTKVAKPKVIPIKTDRQKEGERLASMKEKAGDIKQLGSKSELGMQKNIDQMLNPLTAFGYAARNEEMPRNFGKGPRNILDNVVDIVNPFYYAKKGLSAIDNTASGVSNVAKGKLPSAKRDFKNAAVDALEVLPAAASIVGEVKLAERLIKGKNYTAKNAVRTLDKSVGKVDDVVSSANKLKTNNEPAGIKSINKILESVDGKNYASKYKSVKKAPSTQGASSSTLDNIMNYSKTGKEPQKKIVGYLDDASEEPTLFEKFSEKWKNDTEKSFRKIGEETGKHLKEFEATHGASYSERDANLFARLKGTDAGKRDPLVTNVIKEENDKFKYAEEFGYTKSARKDKRKVDNAFAAKHGIGESGYTKTDELLNNVYSQGYDSKINGRTAHIDGTVNKKFYKKDIAPRLENLVTKNKLKSEETLYRGDRDYAVKKVWRNGEKLPKGSVSFSNLQKGDVWKPGSFVSTSIDKNVASGFGKIRSEIKAPAGQSTLYSNSVRGGQFTSEKEALLPSKLKFKVEGKKGTGGNIDFKHSIVNPYTVAGAIGGSMMFSGNKKK